MAIINTLRNKAGKVVVVAITITMAAFVLGDITANTTLFGGQDRDIAEIDGKEITYEDFQARVDQLSSIFALNYGTNPGGEQMDQIRNMAWQSFFVENAFDPEFNSIGLEVSEAEQIDMVQGDNTHPHVIQMMSNPQTGQFDKSYVSSFLQNLNEAPVTQKQSWVMFENTLAPSRKMMRLDMLMDKTNYVTAAEGRSQHQSQNSNVTIEYVYVPFNSIVDSTVSVSEAELIEYIDNNEKEYERDETRDIAYVSFPIVPSAADSAVIIEEMNEAVEGLRMAENDSAFASRNSDGSFPFMTYKASTLPEYLLNDGQPLSPGEVTEVNVVIDRMTVYKMSRVGEAREYSVKASHILVKWEDDSDEAKATAKSKANDVLRRARRGEDFSQLAADNSEDPSNAQRGGDLGWFTESGPMVPEFNEPIFAFSGTGVLPELVETQFGYHIVKVDEPKNKDEYKVAIIEKEFYVSKDTRDEAYRSAGLLQTSASDAAEFLSKAEQQELDVQRQTRISPQATRIGSYTEARSLVLWLYNDAEVGTVSDVFELGDNYIVAAMTGMQEEGAARVNDVENQVTLRVRNEKKAEIISSKLEGLSGSFEEIAASYGEGAKTAEATVTLSSNNISGVGQASEAVGTAFAMNEGDTTTPITTTNGVVILKVISKNTAEETDDYSFYLQQLTNQRGSRKVMITDFPLTYFRVLISDNLDKAVKELSGLEDNRHKFF